ncbi:MAG: CotH kinase family protein, partial [Planctomycetota bacterium]
MLGYVRISLLVCLAAASSFASARADYPADDPNPGGPALFELPQRHLPLAINEFMASNRNSMQDPQGEFDDWIEIHNYGPDAIDLGGMYLTDDLTNTVKWRIPGYDPAATTVAAGGYLLIWADNDTTDSGLHASFRLSAGGEEIGLFDNDGVTLIDSLEFPEQSADVSFGRFPDAEDGLRFFGFPSPEAENTGGYLGEVADVEFSVEEGIYDTPFTVTLATETEGAVIYYSVDGTEPGKTGGRSLSGRVYTGPISVTGSTSLRAVALMTGWKSSNVRMQPYVFLDTDITTFSSNLPIAIVDTFGESVSQNRHTPAFASFIDTTSRGRAKMIDPPALVTRAGIDIRGKSSTGFAKKQYHFETWDDTDSEVPVSILGFPAESDWVLQGPYSDKSLMRNYLSYNWSNEMGQYASRTRFIEVFLNSDGRGVSMSDYVGVYVLMEKIKRGKDRVDIEQLGPEDNAEPEITGGYIFKKDKLDSGEPTFNTSTGLTLIYVDPNGHDITEPQKNWLRSHLIEFETALNGPNFKDPNLGYRKYIDVDSFINIHILVELTKNIDGFRLSTYMYKDRGGKIVMGPAWDYNLSLGNADYLNGWVATGWYYDLISAGDYPWWRRIFEDPWFQRRYADRWFELRNDLFTTARLLGYIDETAKLLDEAQARNFNRWKILGSRLWPNWYVAQTYDEEITWMKGWLEDRLNWMDRQIGTEFAAASPAFNQQGGYVAPGFELTMTAMHGAIYYTLDGSDPYQPVISQDTGGTLVAENAEKYVLVPVRAVGDTWKDPGGFNDRSWMRAAGSPGGIGYDRESGYDGLISLDVETQMYSRGTTCYIRIPFVVSDNPEDFNSLNLNVRYDDGFIAYLNGAEVARRNVSPSPVWNDAAAAERPDAEAVWFESIDISSSLGLLHQGSNLLAIHGMNSSANDPDFLISAELISPSEDSSEADLPGVNRYTGPITIDKTSNIKARSLTGGTWSALNEANFSIGPIAENLRITEIMYNPPDGDEEFIELTNIGAETIDLNLVRFTNGIDFTFPSLEIPAGGYVVVVRNIDAFHARYGPIVDIAGQYSGKLNNAGERITLADATGRIILDFNFKDGWRSVTDGEGFSLTATDPTNSDLSIWQEKDFWHASTYAGGSPGRDDSGLIPGPGAVVFNELLAHSHDDASDWIELHNTTDTAIDIGGWFISDSQEDLAKYEIAAGTILGPNGYLVFYQNLQFGNADDPGCHEPFALSENGEQVYLTSGQGGALTGYRNVEDFGASLTGESFGRHYKPSTGNYHFVAMSEATPGSANAAPKVGPVVISEIMYNPDWPLESPYTDDQYEYVELHNVSDEPVTLYDYDKAESWKFSDGIEFTFPADPAVTIAPGAYLLIVKDPTAFAWRYPDVPADRILGPYEGRLNDAGERLELIMPGDVDASGELYFVRVDRVVYSDGTHPAGIPGSIDLWPTEPDGNGQSLTRKVATDYGNDPDNW